MKPFIQCMIPLVVSVFATGLAFNAEEGLEGKGYQTAKSLPDPAAQRENQGQQLSKRKGFDMSFIPHHHVNPTLTSAAATWKLRQLIHEYLSTTQQRPRQYQQQQPTSTPSSSVEPVAFFFKPPAPTRFSYDDARWPLAPAASTISPTVVTPPGIIKNMDSNKRVVVKKRKIKKPRAWSPPSGDTNTIDEILQQLKIHHQQQQATTPANDGDEEAFSMHVGISHKGESGYRVPNQITPPNDVASEDSEQTAVDTSSRESGQDFSDLQYQVSTTSTPTPTLNDNNIEPPNPLQAPPLVNEGQTSIENWPRVKDNYFAFFRQPVLPTATDVMTGDVYYFNSAPPNYLSHLDAENATGQPATTAFFYKPSRPAVFAFLSAANGAPRDLVSSDSTPTGFARPQLSPVAAAATSTVSYFAPQPPAIQPFAYNPFWAPPRQRFPPNYRPQVSTPAPIFVHETIRPGPAVPIATLDHLRHMFGQPIQPLQPFAPTPQHHHPAAPSFQHPSYAIYRHQLEQPTTPLPTFHHETHHFIHENVLPGLETEPTPSTTPAAPHYVVQRPSNEFWKPLLQPYPVSAGAADQAGQKSPIEPPEVNEIRQPESFPTFPGQWESKKVNKLLRKQTKKMMKHLLRMKPELGRGIPGVIGVDYPTYRRIPTTEFRCARMMPGYYADQGSRCQGFHLCHGDGRMDSFLCPNGTIFNQETLVCDWWYSTDCERADEYFGRNRKFVADLLDQHSKRHNFGNAVASQTDYATQEGQEHAYYPFLVSRKGSNSHDQRQNLV